MSVTLKVDERFPVEIRELFSHLAGQTINMREKWTMFHALFFSSENVRLLNETAPTFFSWTQQALLDDLILSLLRMLDRLSTGQPNLVLQRLLDALSPDVRAEIGTTLKSSLHSAHLTARTLRHHRDKRIAHHDLKILVGGVPLEPTTCTDIRQTLEHIEAFLDTIYSYFVPNTQSMWDMPNITSGSDSLLAYLRLAKDRRR
jgi:hypothetical protein